MDSYIYITQFRGFVDQNEPTYKIGKTTRPPEQRMQEYPKGSKLLLLVRVNDCHTFESWLIKKFNKLFVKRTDHGNEFYSGDIDEMIKIVTDRVYYEHTLERLEKQKLIVQKNIVKRQEGVVKLQNEPLTLLINEEDFIDAENMDMTDDLLEDKDNINITSEDLIYPNYTIPVQLLKHSDTISAVAIHNKRPPSESLTQKFINFIINFKPDWYQEDQWVLKDLLYNEYTKICGDEPKKGFTTKFKGIIYKSEVRKVIDNKRQYIIKLFKFSDIKIPTVF
jgi:hypothetical protein